MEVLFKEPVQDSGLGDYQILAEDGMIHHLHPVADRRAEIARDQIERLVPGEHHATLRQKLCEQLLAA